MDCRASGPQILSLKLLSLYQVLELGRSKKLNWYPGCPTPACGRGEEDWSSRPNDGCLKNGEISEVYHMCFSSFPPTLWDFQILRDTGRWSCTSTFVVNLGSDFPIDQISEWYFKTTQILRSQGLFDTLEG